MDSTENQQPPLPLQPPAVPFIRMRVVLVVLAILTAIGVDQLSKLSAQKNLMVWSHESDKGMYQGSRKQLILIGNDMPASADLTPFFMANLNYVRNPGAAWGTFAKMPQKFREPFFYVITAIALAVIIYFLKITPWQNTLARAGLYLILAGAIGNFLDRLRQGFVIDWLDLRWRVFGWRYNFPAFNAADIYISVGVALLAFDLIVREPQRKRAGVVMSQRSENSDPPA